MAKYYNLIRVSTPTGLTAQLQAGGTLPVGTTYYYRVTAFRRYQPSDGPSMPVLSAPTAEVSVTTDATNRTVQLSWDPVADAYGYYVQRTTVSGSYPVHSGNTLSVSGKVAILTATTLVDDGAVSFSGQSLDFSEEAPLTEVYSDNNDTIEQAEILNYAQSQGWTHIRCPFPANILASTNIANVKQALPLFFNGGLYLHDCKFRWRGAIGVINGIFYSAPTVEFVTDAGSYGDTPTLMTYSIGYPTRTNDGKTSSGSFGCLVTIRGTGRLALLTMHTLARSATSGYSTLQYCNSIVDGIQIDLGYSFNRIANWYILSNTTASYFCCGTVGLGDGVKRIITFGPVLASDNCENTDIIFYGEPISSQLGHFQQYVVVNPVFLNQNPTATAYIVSTNINYVAFTASYTLSFTLSDSSGNPIQNAQIYLTDARGLPANFVKTNATSSVSMNDTDTYTTISVTNAGELSIGDVVRVRGSDEHMLVTNKVGSSVTFQRGYNGTSKRKHTGNNYIKYEKLSPLTTDTNGQATVKAQSWMLVNKSTASYVTNTLDWLVQNGYFDRFYMTPYTLRIEAAGYETYRDVLAVDRPLSLEIALSPGRMATGITEHVHAVC